MDRDYWYGIVGGLLAVVAAGWYVLSNPQKFAWLFT